MSVEANSQFSPETPWEIRKQILDYQATACMSDVERAAYFGLPKGCRMREGAKIISPQNLKIGEDCWIGEGAVLDASGGLEIGANTSIGLGVFLWTHDSHKNNIRGENTRDASHKIKRAPTKIGSNCFISGPTVVMPGVTVGDKCIIAPMSVVYEDLPDRTVYKPYRQFFEGQGETVALRGQATKQQGQSAEIPSQTPRGEGALAAR
jgi:acetyltransferase-like isoleucine patch superfamily enzyme